MYTRSGYSIYPLWYYYVWAMPKYIEFALVLSRFYFSMLYCYFSLGFHTINMQYFSDSQAVCYNFFKISQVLFRKSSGFSGSLSVNRCWVSNVHIGGLWYPISPCIFIQSTSTLGTILFMYSVLLLWLFVLVDLFMIFWITMYGLMLGRWCTFRVKP